MRPAAHLVFALIVCAVTLTGYAAAYHAVTAKSDLVAALESQIDARTETVNRLTSARASLAELSTDEGTLENYFVAQSRIVPFIDGLQAGGRALGSTIQVDSVSTGGTTAEPTLVLALTIDGPFDSVMRTVGAIEYGPYALSVTRLSLSSAGKGSWEAQFNILVGSRADTATSTTP